MLDKFNNIEDILDYVYKKYSEYTIRSQRGDVNLKAKLNEKTGFFLIGYEGKDIDEFLKILLLNNITTLVDVRFNPRSMKYDFNKKRLATVLESVGIKYVGIPSLGIETSRRKNLDEKGRREELLERYANELEYKKDDLYKIEQLGRHERVAIMCFERDFKMCHRREIGKFLKTRGYNVSILI
ncbi:MAG: DUF488 domain-containing protein [Promethearchaeota archaeon]